MTLYGKTDVLKFAPTTDDTPDYSDGDVFGTLITVPACRGMLATIALKSEDALAANDVTAIIFDANPSSTTFTDNGAMAVHDDDLSKIIGFVSLDENLDVGDGEVLQARNIGIPLATTGTAFYIIFRANAAINLSVTDGVTVAIGVLQD